MTIEKREEAELLGNVDLAKHSMRTARRELTAALLALDAFRSRQLVDDLKRQQEKQDSALDLSKSDKEMGMEIIGGLSSPHEVCIATWQPGTVVLLRSYGPKMTIEAIDGPTATCSWFIDGRLERAVFPVCALREM